MWKTVTRSRCPVSVCTVHEFRKGQAPQKQKFISSTLNFTRDFSRGNLFWSAPCLVSKLIPSSCRFQIFLWLCGCNMCHVGIIDRWRNVRGKYILSTANIYETHDLWQWTLPYIAARSWDRCGFVATRRLLNLRALMVFVGKNWLYGPCSHKWSVTWLDFYSNVSFSNTVVMD